MAKIGHFGWWRFGLFSLAFLVANEIARAQGNYTVTPLTFTPIALNASGVVVGQNGQLHACVFNNGQLMDVGTLGGSSSAATAVNSSGQIAGYSKLSGDSFTHAFLYSNGQMVDLGALPGGSLSYAKGINDAGSVTGYSDTRQAGTNYPDPDHAFIYSGGHMTDLGNVSATGVFGNFSEAAAINPGGQVTGWSNTDAGTPHAFLFSGGHMTDIGAAPAPYNYGSYAKAINVAGDIVGFSEDQNLVHHAFVYSHGMLTDLGVPSGYTQSNAVGINDSGQIVGTLSGGASPYCFIYSSSTGFVNIQSLISDPNVTISSVEGINNAGQIIATGSDFGPDGGNVVGFLLTPNGSGGPAPSPTVTPSPSPTSTPVQRNQYLRLVGNVTWQTNGKTAVVTASQITYSKANATSNPIRLELWAFSHAFGGVPASGYRLGTYSVPALQGGSSYSNINSGPVTFTAPPNGWWHIAVLLTEQTNLSSVDDGYSFDDWVDFAVPYAVGGNAVPTPTPAQLANISTRGVIRSGDGVMIGGFIVTGSAQKKVMVRGIGPSLPVSGALPDPTLELHGQSGVLATNDNWQDTNANEIAATGIAPTNALEPALIATLGGNNGAYTAVLSGKNGASGVGLIEVYDLSMSASSTLANLSTRGYVDVGDDVMIGGFITTPVDGASKILVRGIGPSLTAQGVSGALVDPMLELHDANGATVASNDNWKDSQAADIQATGIPPTIDAESAIVQVLWAGNYTAVLRGNNNSSGVGLVEVYNLR